MIQKIEPVLGWYDPAGQEVHADAPIFAVYAPNKHGEQLLAPTEEYVPGTQLKHVDVPELTSYKPAAQLEHTLAPDAE